MATVRDSGWFRQADGVWARNFGVERIYYVTTAYVRLNGARYEVGTGDKGAPDAWQDYCASDGFFAGTRIQGQASSYGHG